MAISRGGLEDSRVLENDHMCSQHFILGKPAYLYYDEANPDWLPMLLLGHAKKKANSSKKVLNDLRERRQGEKLQKKWR